MAETITLRPAMLADAKNLAQLWVTAFPDKFGPLLGNKAEPVLCDWLRLSQCHLQTTTIAEINEAIVGFIVLETPADPRPDDGRWLWQALQLNNSFGGALRGLLLMSLLDHHHHLSPNEVYIEMLGVNPVWRGHGVGQLLIGHAEAMAQQQGMAQLALAVVNDNLPALNLYQKLGFAISSEQRSRFLKWLTGHPGYYEMVKELSIVKNQLSK
jgi:ribosomal protein S18 acetylase RimI-like enzyme